MKLHLIHNGYLEYRLTYPGTPKLLYFASWKPSPYVTKKTLIDVLTIKKSKEDIIAKAFQIPSKRWFSLVKNDLYKVYLGNQSGIIKCENSRKSIWVLEMSEKKYYLKDTYVKYISDEEGNEVKIDDYEVSFSKNCPEDFLVISLAMHLCLNKPTQNNSI